jgi:hypothetical protein
MAYHEPVQIKLCGNGDGRNATHVVYTRDNFYVGTYCASCAETLSKILSEQEEGISGINQ